MIYLLTGQNGHGKTLRAMQLGLAELAQGREVFLCNVQGVDYEKTGFRELDKLENWQSLPDGAMVIVDECWEFIPARAVGKNGPKWELDLATHRHRGFDFILVCQAGTQISTHVRALVHEHTHVRRKWGSQKAMLLTWDRFQPSTASTSEVRDARKQLFAYPKSIFGIYKSATVHTSKRNLPWQMFAIPVLLVLVVGIGWFVFHRFQHQADIVTPGAVAATPAPAGGASSAPGAHKAPAKTDEEYATEYEPRIAAQPWSAPWHDGAKSRADPDVYCVISDLKGCQCYTEQVTRLAVPVLQCMTIARNGIYNPFRASLRQELDPSNPGLRGGNPQTDRYGQAVESRRGSVPSYDSLPLPGRVPDALQRVPMVPLSSLMQ